MVKSMLAVLNNRKEKKVKLLTNRRSLTLTFVIHLCLGLFCLACILPMILTISASLSDAKSIANFGYTLVPKRLTYDAYRLIFLDSQKVINGYRISFYITIVGTVINLFITALIAYPLSRADFRAKGIISTFIFITMIFSGGIVPFYILVIRYLHWKNTMWALMIPGIAAPFNIFLLRVFFQDIPASLVESAKIDGSSDLNTFINIIIPLSLPAMATLGLMIALGYWNDPISAMYFIDKQKLYPLQLILTNIITYLRLLKQGTFLIQSGSMISPQDIPSDAVMYAMMIITTVPMLFLFSLLQKYFIKGITAGAIKG